MGEGLCLGGLCVSKASFVFFSDLAQIAMTIIAAYIAYQAHSFARKASKLNFIIASTNILNGINETSISTQDHADALLRLRPGVSDDIYKDYIALMNLNYLHTIWSLREERVIGRPLADSKIQNGIGFLLQSPPDYVNGLLRRGFPDSFREEIFGYYQAAQGIDAGKRGP